MYSALVCLSQISRAPHIDPRHESTDLAELTANISVNGLAQPPLLRCIQDNPPLFEIVAGNRRIQAVAAIRDAGGSIKGERLDADPMIPVWVYPLGELSDDEARALALAENVCREDLHPVDEFEAFAQRVNAGASVEAIAAEYHCSARDVLQRLALGQLHEGLRAAWRNAELDFEQATTFTLIPDLARQMVVFEDLRKRGVLCLSQIRAAAGVDYSANDALEIVGAEAYRAAGGVIVEDLFGDSNAVSDPDLARRMLVELINDRCKKLEDDGWSFAVPRACVKEHYTWPKLAPKVGYTADERRRKTEAAAIALKYQDADLTDAQADELEAANKDAADVEITALQRAFKPELRAQSGCFVYASGGKLQIDFGVQRPALTRKESPAKTATAGEQADSAPTISNAVAHDLSVMRTVIISRALMRDPRLVLELVVSTLRTGDPNGPLRIKAQGLPQLTPESESTVDYLLPNELEAARDRTTEQLLEDLAILGARAIDVRRGSAATLMNDDEGALCAAIDAGVWREVERDAFDAQSYFARIPVPLLITALKEMLGADYAANGKKADLVEAAVAQARETGWVPPELRHPSEFISQS